MKKECDFLLVFSSCKHHDNPLLYSFVVSYTRPKLSSHVVARAVITFDSNAELDHSHAAMVPPMLITIPSDIQSQICAEFLHPLDILALRGVRRPLTRLFYHFKATLRLVNIFNLLQKNV